MKFQKDLFALSKTGDWWEHTQHLPANKTSVTWLSKLSISSLRVAKWKRLSNARVYRRTLVGMHDVTSTTFISFIVSNAFLSRCIHSVYILLVSRWTHNWTFKMVSLYCLLSYQLPRPSATVGYYKADAFPLKTSVCADRLVGNRKLWLHWPVLGLFTLVEMGGPRLLDPRFANECCSVDLHKPWLCDHVYIFSESTWWLHPSKPV